MKAKPPQTVLLIGLNLTLFAGPSSADVTNVFTAASGLYESAGNWSLGHIPTTDDTQTFIYVGKNVTNDSDVSAWVPPTLTVGWSGSQTAYLTLTTNAVMKIGNRLVLGASGPGTGGGYWGQGTMIINGGSLSVGALDPNTAIIVGSSGYSSAMTLTNGATLEYKGALFFVPNGGAGANGTLTVSDGCVLSAPAAALKIGNPAAVHGYAYLNGGTVNVSSINVGDTTYNNGDGTVIQTGGDVTVSNTVLLAQSGSPSSYRGMYTLSGGTLTIAGNGGLYAGTSPAMGLLTLSNGVLRVNKVGSGKLTTRFSGGTLSAYSGGLAILTGIELQSGGTGPVFDTTAGPIAVSNVLSGAGGFLKAGNGDMTLTKTNAFAGPATVSAGTLRVTASNTLPCTAVTVRAGATLAVAANVTAQAFGTNTVLTLASTSGQYGQVSVDTAVTQTVWQLVVDGVLQSRGTWGKSGSGAKHIDDRLFIGSGLLNVLDAGPEKGTCVYIY